MANAPSNRRPKKERRDFDDYIDNQGGQSSEAKAAEPAEIQQFREACIEIMRISNENGREYLKTLIELVEKEKKKESSIEKPSTPLWIQIIIGLTFLAGVIFCMTAGFNYGSHFSPEIQAMASKAVVDIPVAFGSFLAGAKITQNKKSD